MKRLLALVTSSLAIALAAALLAAPAQAEFRLFVTNGFNDRVDVYDETGAGQGSFGSGTLLDPFGVATGLSGDVFVADTGNNAIRRFTPEGTLTQTITGGIFVSPTDLVVDGAGNIVVTFGGSDAVVTFDPSGTVLSSYSTGGPGSAPRAITIGSDGTHYVSLVGDGGNFNAPPGPNDRIAKFVGGAHVGDIGTGGTGPAQFNNPVGVAFDGAGNLIVLEQGNSRFQRLTPQGTFLGQFGGFGTGNGQFLFPLGLEGTPNALYAADSFNDRIQILDLNGNFLNTFATNLPTAIAVGSVTAPPGSVLISGTKFEDVNGNGTQDTGENGLPGWTIYVDRDGNGVLDGGEPVVTSDASGRFEFTPALPGEFKIREVLQTGWRQTTAPVDLTADAGATPDVKVGNFKDVKVTGTVFEDGNRDGVRDAGEDGLQGWTVFWDDNGDGVRQDNEPLVGTGPGGGYTLERIGPGSGTLTVEPQVGWTSTTSPGLLIATSGLETTQDLGVARLLNGRIVGVKFDDLNGNEQRDPGEPRLGGWTIYLDLNENGVLDAGEPVETTNDVDPALRGDVAFNGLRPGVYVVREVPQPGWAPMRPQVVTVSDGSTAEIDLPNSRHGSVDGTVFEDRNADGERDPGEQGLPDWKAYLDLNLNGTPDAQEPSATTGPDGVYHIGELPPSDGVMRVVPQEGFEVTTPPDSGTTITSGLELTRDFGVRGTGGILGVKFEDLDNDGRGEDGEPLLDDVTLFLDANGNGVLDPGETATTAAGQFGFEGLAPGTYTLAEVPRPGWQPLEPRQVTVSPGPPTFVEVPNRRFGTAQGFVYHDRDGNNARDAGEPALVGWTLFVDQDDDGTLDTGEQQTTTAADGSYRFADLGSGDAALAVQTQPGWQTTDVDYYRFTITSGTAVTRDFGFDRTVDGSIDVFAFTDVAGDGSQDAGDAGLAGVRVFLDSNNDGALNDGEPNGVTDGAGGFTFTGLSAGTYRVREASFPSADYVQTTADPGAVEINADNQTASVRFGAFQLAQVAGTVFEDLNGNDARDAGERGLENWSVLLDLNDNGTFDAGEQMTATTSAGGYSFTGVGPGAAVVVEVQPGWEGVHIFDVTPTSGETVTHDFGFVLPLAISDLLAAPISPNDIKLTFTTSRDATAAVQFGARTWLEGTPPVTNHVIVLSGLEPETSYVMDVFAETEDGRTATASATAETPPLGDFRATLATTPVSGLAGTPFTANIAVLTTKLTESLRFVADVYRDVLGREIDPDAAGFWIAALANGTRADVALGLQQTTEFRSTLVRGYYTQLLRRAAAQDEVDARVASLQAGVSQQGVIALLLGSDEYFVRFGGTNEAFVAQLHRDVLQREATTGEAGAVLGALSAGQSREAAALELLKSSEALTSTVRGYYLRFLGHEPDPNGLAFFRGLLQGQSSNEQVAAALIGSAEYLQRLSASDEVVTRAGTATIETDGHTVAGALQPTGVNTFRVVGDLSYDAAGTYDVGVTVFDGANVVVGATTAEIRDALGGGASLVPDATDPTKTELRVLGTSAGDRIALDRPGGGAIRVVLNGVSAGLFSPTGRIVVDVLAGSDTVTIASTISRRSWVYAGSGDDVVNAASSGGNLLLGGDGNDRLSGGAGRDLLIGGSGADVLGGSGGDDILIGGLTTLDGDTAALAGVMAEWGSTNSYAVKVDNLTRFFGPGTTVPNDGEADELRGARARDWFLASVNDFTDAGSGEIVTLIP